MPNSFSKIYLHVVFATKRRQKIIDNSWKERLLSYICGTVSGKKQKVLAINCMPDHLHVLLGLNGDVNIPDLVRDLKANASRWINENRLVRGKFNWQHGYAAFSVGYSQLDTVGFYIRNQENHHRQKSFRDEYVTLLTDSGFEFDPRYLFDKDCDAPTELNATRGGISAHN